MSKHCLENERGINVLHAGSDHDDYEFVVVCYLHSDSIIVCANSCVNKEHTSHIHNVSNCDDI